MYVGPRPPNIVSSGGDNMETGAEAIRDIAEVLKIIASQLGVKSHELRLWDPYYCTGSVKESYAASGFPLCYNEPEDFYAKIAGKEQDLPPHDCICTNPPYSGSHIERALHYVVRRRADGSVVPWAMLLPSHVLARNWWPVLAQKMQHGGIAAPLFLAPNKRYSFTNKYEVDSKATTKVAPLETLWFIGGLTSRCAERLRRHFGRLKQQQQTKSASLEKRCNGCTLASSFAELPRRIRKIHVYAERRAAKRSTKRAASAARGRLPKSAKKRKRAESLATSS